MQMIVLASRHLALCGVANRLTMSNIASYDLQIPQVRFTIVILANIIRGRFSRR